MEQEESKLEIFDPWTRRGFLKKSAVAALGAFLGAEIAFGNHLPKGWLPLQVAEGDLPGKHPGLVILNKKPWNAETPDHLLDDSVTPNDLHFVRNNGHPPPKVDPDTWTLEITGESVKRTVTLSLADLKSKFKTYSYQLVLECGGNGRKEFNPPAKGNQWGNGAVGCSQWTGVRLKDVLNYVGVKSDAVYIGYKGKDIHLTGDSSKPVISRGVPLSKAMEDESLIAWAMNGEDIPMMNGYPLRLVFGGWPASTSGKWLSQILVRNKVHDGAKMGGNSYRVPCKPVAPGTKVKEEDMCIIESMPVKSLITYPKTGAMLRGAKNQLTVRGHAWAGDLAVKEMHVSIDYGATWQKCTLKAPANRLSWQDWSATVTLPGEGYYEIWARATDTDGRMQPMVVPNWNPKGYLNNACHRIAVKKV